MLTRPQRPVVRLSKTNILLLQSALLRNEQAIQAWKSWQIHNDLNSVNSSAYQLLPLLYLNLSQFSVKLPEMGRLRGIYKHTWTANQLAKRTLLEVGEFLEEAGASLLLHRSLALTILQVCDQGAFPLREINLLAKTEELQLIDSVLQKKGWQSNKPLPSDRLFPLVHSLSYHHPQKEELSLVVRWGAYTIDSTRELERQLWERANQSSWDGLTIHTPDLNDCFLLTCLEGLECRPEQLPKLIAEASILVHLARPSLDWMVIEERARQLGILNAVCEIMAHLHQEIKVMISSKLIHLKTLPSNTLEDLDLPSEDSLRGSVARLCESYRKVYTFRKQGFNPVDCFLFVLSYYQFSWGIRKKWMVPWVAVVKVLRRLRGSGTPQYKSA